jgi:hypothetical protein
MLKQKAVASMRPPSGGFMPRSRQPALIAGIGTIATSRWISSVILITAPS